MAQINVEVVEAYATGETLAVFADMFDEDQQLLIECVVTADFVQDHYGVPGSPVWMSATNEAVDTITVNDIDYSVREAEAMFGGDAVNAIWEMALDAAAKKEASEWE